MLVEKRDFLTPPRIRRPVYGGARQNTAIPFGVGKLVWWGYEDMYITV